MEIDTRFKLRRSISEFQNGVLVNYFNPIISMTIKKYVFTMQTDTVAAAEKRKGKEKQCE